MERHLEGDDYVDLYNDFDNNDFEHSSIYDQPYVEPSPSMSANPELTNVTTLSSSQSAAQMHSPQKQQNVSHPLGPSHFHGQKIETTSALTTAATMPATSPSYALPNQKPDFPNEGKIFVGGLNWETTDETLLSHFEVYGTILTASVMRDPMTGRSRGFGFVTYQDPSVLNKVLRQKHLIDGKMVDPKPAVPRDEQERTEKIFVGGIPPEITEADFHQFFSQFGVVVDANLMMDRNTGRPRGFGFITFESKDGVQRALEVRNLELGGKMVEIKQAVPRSKVSNPRNMYSAGGYEEQQYGGYGNPPMAAGGPIRGYGGNRAYYPQPGQSRGGYNSSFNRIPRNQPPMQPGYEGGYYNEGGNYSRYEGEQYDEGAPYAGYGGQGGYPGEAAGFNAGGPWSWGSGDYAYEEYYEEEPYPYEQEPNVPYNKPLHHQSGGKPPRNVPTDREREGSPGRGRKPARQPTSHSTSSHPTDSSHGRRSHGYHPYSR